MDLLLFAGLGDQEYAKHLARLRSGETLERLLACLFWRRANIRDELVRVVKAPCMALSVLIIILARITSKWPELLQLG